VGFSVLFLPLFTQACALGVKLNLESVVDVVVLVLALASLLFVIVFPIIIVVFWVRYSQEYVREFRYHFSLKKWFANRSDFSLENLPDLLWIKYRATYSKMIAFGFSVMAYVIACAVYMVQNFDGLDKALVEYFSFPFKVLNNFGSTESRGGVMLPMEEVWIEMLYIVLISIIFFLAGYIFGSFLVDFRLRRLRKGKPEAIGSKSAKKEESPLTHFW
jgi:hypothetical protein